ncbi:MAG: serine hydrolase [Rheinheimera sp.]|nr:serine hydrolase [Rheinheimera sp.]
MSKFRINEFGLNQKFSAQYENWIKPAAALELLEKFYAAELLSSHSQQLLWDLMLETPTGQKRLKAGIGNDALLAQKLAHQAKIPTVYWLASTTSALCNCQTAALTPLRCL